jgi:LuxR family maltose regulon positive regulatory protein
MTIALTKIQPPRPRAGLVERGALQARLADALRTRRLVLLSAPAGYGKTTLLAQEVARMPAGSAVAWISADSGDDLQRLLECMLAALEPFDPPWRSAPEALLTQLGQRSSDELRAVAAEIINTLDACEAPHGVIVFDDVHRIDDPAFFRFLDLLIERMSPRWCVALTSRTEPPLALGRLRAHDDVAEFRQLQLQFARDEAQQLAHGAGIDAPLADRLFDRTHGWPAALRIAVGAVQASAEPASARGERALRTSERPLFEFLVSEVLEQLPPELADFLLATSVLPELGPARCSALTGVARPAEHLDAIERLGLCIDVIDTPERALRLHDLLREVLQLRLQQRDPARLALLRRRVADTEPDPIRRITLLLDAGDVPAAAQLAFDHLPPLIVTSGAGTTLHIVSQFPSHLRDALPELAFVRGLASWGQHWDFPVMLQLMQRAEDEFMARGDTERAQLASAYIAIALIAIGRSDEGAAVLARLRNQALPARTEAIVLTAEAWYDIDVCRYTTVAPLMRRLLDVLQLAGRLDLWYQTTPPLRMPGLPGITPVLERHAELMLRVAGDAPTPLRAIAVQTQAWCALWRGRIDEARELVESARDDAHWSGQTHAVRAHQFAINAVLALVAGDAPAAVAAAEARLAAFSPTGSPWHRYVLAIFLARVAATGGDLAALRAALARVETERAAAGPLADPERRARPRELPLQAQLAWLEGRRDDAIGDWRASLAMEGAIHVMGYATEVRVRLASALLERDDAQGAADALAPVFPAARIDGPGGALLAGEALQTVASYGWGRLLRADEAAELRSWWQIVAAERATHLGIAAGAEAAAGTTATVIDAREALPATLTARELEVLARIAAGDSNKLIAREFDLSLHTVKRHVANILGKLGVDTRGQAAARHRAQARC